MTSVAHILLATAMVLASRSYERLPSGEPERITYEDGREVELTYDGAGRVESETRFDGQGALERLIEYAYDADGRRTAKVTDGVEEAYGYEPGARLTEVTVGGAEVAAYAYDGAGRTTAITRDDLDYALTYDSEGHVRSIEDAGAPLAAYTFDAEGRRDSATYAGTSRRYLVAPAAGAGLESPQAVTDDAGALLASYVYGGEHALSRTTATGTRYYLRDPMGTVIAVADEAGTVVATYDYDAFGGELAADGIESELPEETLGDFGYQGMWLDPTGLYYARARSYDPETGRFLSRDPAAGALTRPETLEPYTFANGNPYLYRDPTGRYSLVELQAANAVRLSIGGGQANAGLSFLNALTEFRNGTDAVAEAYAQDLAIGMVGGAVIGIGVKAVGRVAKSSWKWMLTKLNPGSTKSAATATSKGIAWIVPGSLPNEEERALLVTLEHIAAGTKPKGKAKANWAFLYQNKGDLLPGGTGAASPYREYRVHPGASVSGGGARRVVVNSETGEMYYSWTHYGDPEAANGGVPSFVRIR